MLKSLIKISNELDAKGLFSEADLIDALIEKLAESKWILVGEKALMGGTFDVWQKTLPDGKVITAHTPKGSGSPDQAGQFAAQKPAPATPTPEAQPVPEEKSMLTSLMDNVSSLFNGTLTSAVDTEESK